MRTTFRLLLLTLILGPCVSEAARELVPVPPAVDDGSNVLAEDQRTPEGLTPRSLQVEEEGSPAEAADGEERIETTGGHDVRIYGDDNVTFGDLAVASDGTILSLANHSGSDNVRSFRIMRSDDHGTTWDTWGEIEGTDPAGSLWDPVLVVAEGVEDRVFVAYTEHLGSAQEALRVAWSDLDLEDADFSNDRLIYESASYIHGVSMDADDFAFSDYYLYLVWSTDGDGAGGDDIYFSRNTTRGGTWNSPYIIGSLSSSDRGYYNPCVSVGFGGYVHVSWSFGADSETGLDSAARYRRAPNYGGDGQAGWEPIQTLSSYLNGVDEYFVAIAASQTGEDVLVAWSRTNAKDAGAKDWPGIGVVASANSGEGWGDEVIHTSTLARQQDLLHQDDNARWLMAASGSQKTGYIWCPVSDPGAWSDLQAFSDENDITGLTQIAIDPAHQDRVAVTGVRRISDSLESLWFDAEWRTDPGYPVLENGFPRDLSAAPISSPALVDVDGDDDLEIVFSDEDGRIQVLRPSGTSLWGWPVDVGVTLSNGPVAVGDLNGDGEPTIVVGGTDGNAYAFDPEGNLLPGWPAPVTPPGYDIYVSIGSMSPLTERSVVCTGANYITFRNHQGSAPPGALGWTFADGGAEHITPACIGDVDQDGVSELVGAVGRKVFCFEYGVHAVEFTRNLPHPVSGALTLADLDLDGDLEILCPTEEGVLYALDHNGDFLGGGFPYDTGLDDRLTSAVVADCRLGAEPEIAFGRYYFELHMLAGDGTSLSGFPVLMGDYLSTAPVIGRVDYSQSDVVVAGQISRSWAWSPEGYRCEGWPYRTGGNSQTSPAIGDIDLDGSNEIVFLTDEEIHVVDLHNAPNPAAKTWPMAMHDPRRSGCSDCLEDLATAVDPAEPFAGPARISFAGPTPNPMSGGAEFAFAVPARSIADLEIVDLRGRRVARVFREELETGTRLVAWDGRDETGEPVASGQYLARLRVRGPGRDEMLVRKVVVVR